MSGYAIKCFRSADVGPCPMYREDTTYWYKLYQHPRGGLTFTFRKDERAIYQDKTLAQAVLKYLIGNPLPTDFSTLKNEWSLVKVKQKANIRHVYRPQPKQRVAEPVQKVIHNKVKVAPKKVVGLLDEPKEVKKKLVFG